MNPQDVAGALRNLAGTDRVLIYDVAEAGAPHRADPSSPFVRGSDAWWAFVEHRRALDDGQHLNLLISMRGLRYDERLLVVNWGTAFANSFLLIEPADPWLDLTTREGLESFGREHGSLDAEALVRTAYADWNYWTRDETGELDGRSATLSLDAAETLWSALYHRLPQTFPAASFLSALTLLNLREAELFTGGREVARAIVPFLTRLGLPVVYDARHVIQGVRELVNAGLAWVQDPDDNWRIYHGPSEPIPTDIPDERLAYMLR